jgi:hypothetical protein
MLRFFSHSLFRRAAVAAAALIPAAAISVAAGQPAAAAGCSTNGHVYLTSPSPSSFRFEGQPAQGGFDNYTLPSGGPVSFRVGGNGLRPGTTPYWTINSSVTGQYVFFGRAAGGNCVANEAFVTIPRSPVPGEVWTVTTNYDTGNSGQAIRNQNHYQINYVQRQLPPQLPCIFCAR